MFNLKKSTLFAATSLILMSTSSAFAGRICGMLEINPNGPMCGGPNCPIVLTLVNSEVFAEVIIADGMDHIPKINSLINKNVCISDAQVEVINEVEVIQTTAGKISLLK